MLVLSRKRDEIITIGDDIKIKVLEIGRDQIRLGIVAPAVIPVHRQEVYDAIQGKPRTRYRRRRPTE